MMNWKVWNILTVLHLSMTCERCIADIKLVPELSEKLHNLAVRPCFAVMLAFAKPLSSV